MSFHCKKCEDVQDSRIEGNAPPRRKHEQPTMYDHMEGYTEFVKEKHRKEEEDAKSSQPLEFNPNFTNFKINGEEAGDFLKKLATTDESFKSTEAVKTEVPPVSIKTTGPRNMSKCLVDIPRYPVSCPLTNCHRIVGTTMILKHFLSDHQKDCPIDYQEITGTCRSVLAFNPKIFNYDEILCLGILAYGGKDGSVENLPGIKGLCLPNAFLVENQLNVLNHLPAFIMGCKTGLSSMLEDKQKAAIFADHQNRQQDIIVLWVSTVETTMPVRCTITAFDENIASSRSTNIEVRSLYSSQNPSDFLCKESNYLFLSRGEIDMLSKNEKFTIQLEILIHETE